MVLLQKAFKWLWVYIKFFFWLKLLAEYQSFENYFTKQILTSHSLKPQKIETNFSLHIAYVASASSSRWRWLLRVCSNPHCIASSHHPNIIHHPLKLPHAWNSFKKRREGRKEEEEPKEFSSCPQKCSWEIVFIMFGDEFSPKAFCVCWQTFSASAYFVHGEHFLSFFAVSKIILRRIVDS